MSALLVATFCGCTVFDDVEPPPLGGGGGGASGGGGAGGSESCTVESPRCLLPLIEAARLCALVARCDGLAAGAAFSTGLPLAVLSPGAEVMSFNFSSCVDWLTTPLEHAHAGFETTRAVFNCLAAAATCEQAATCLTYEILTVDDPRCAGSPAPLCDGEMLLDCPQGRAIHCDGLGFPVTSECAEGADGPVCRVDACTEPTIVCAENPPGVHYAIECTEAGDELAVSCTAHGLTCDEEVGCAPPSGEAEVCGPALSQRCGGPDTAVMCAAPVSVAGLRETPIDCGAVGAACVEQGQTARCERPEAECSPYDAGINVCDPEATSVVRMCLGGSPATFDCASLGMKCVNDEGLGVSGRCEP